MLNRRRALQLTGGAMMATAATRRGFAAAAELPRLKEAAEHAGLHYGSDSDIEFSVSPPDYAALFVEQCALYAINMSWGYVCGANESGDPLRVDPNIAFADAHDLGLAGGHLLWHENMPPWFANLTPAEAHKAATAHITTMARKYAGRTYAWNVINEAIEPYDGRPDGLRRSSLLDNLGIDFFDEAFRTARAADPKALLAYNDNDLEASGRYQTARRDALFRLLDGFAARGTPIDAVGLQSHLTIADNKIDEKEYREFLRRIASYKLKIIISELDILDLSTPTGTVERDRAIADLYTRFLNVALDELAVSAVVSWGLSDRYTWLTTKYNPHFGRADGLPSRPLPFDADLQPKPAFYAMISAFNAAPRR